MAPLDSGPRAASRPRHAKQCTALILPELRADGVRANDADPRRQFGDDGGHALLVVGIREGVQQADSNHIGPHAGQGGFQGRANGPFVQRGDGRAVGPRALDDFNHMLSSNQRFRLAIRKIIDARPILPLDPQQIAEPGSRDQRNPGALALEHGVGRDSRPVNELRDLRHADGRRRQRIQHSALRRGRRARNLGDAQHATVRGNQVRECAARFDAHPHRPRPGARSARQPLSCGSRVQRPLEFLALISEFLGPGAAPPHLARLEGKRLPRERTTRRLEG